MKQVKQLNNLIEEYAVNKEFLDGYKKVCDTTGSKVKEIMLNNELKEHKSDKYSATIITRQKTEIKEDKLLNKLKELGVTHLIKTKEYVDMDELENALYSGELNPKQLSDCIVKKDVYALTVKMIGGNK